MESSGTNLKNLKKILGQTLKSQAKKDLSSPCIPIFKKFVTIKKNHINKKTCFNSYDTFILYYIKKEQAINFVLKNILIP